MTRIVAHSGDKTLAKVNDSVWVSLEFYNRGLVSEEDVAKAYKPNQYSVHKLLDEDDSDILGLKMRAWEITTGLNKEVVCVFSDGVKYSIKELEEMDRRLGEPGRDNPERENLVKRVHQFKKIFKGEIDSGTGI